MLTFSPVKKSIFYIESQLVCISLEFYVPDQQEVAAFVLKPLNAIQKSKRKSTNSWILFEHKQALVGSTARCYGNFEKQHFNPHHFRRFKIDFIQILGK